MSLIYNSLLGAQILVKSALSQQAIRLFCPPRPLQRDLEAQDLPRYQRRAWHLSRESTDPGTGFQPLQWLNL